MLVVMRFLAAGGAYRRRSVFILARQALKVALLGLCQSNNVATGMPPAHPD